MFLFFLFKSISYKFTLYFYFLKKIENFELNTAKCLIINDESDNCILTNHLNTNMNNKQLSNSKFNYIKMSHSGLLVNIFECTEVNLFAYY